MRAISLTQPWASLMMDGRKKIETRSWHTTHRGPLAIHAAKSIDREACRYFGYDPETIPRGAVLGTVEMILCFQFGPLVTLRVQEQYGPEELDAGNYEQGRFGFVCTRPVKFERPIPAKGKLGLWKWDPDAKN